MPEVPASLAGWPAEWSAVSIGDAEVELYTVASLETLLDRDRLLRDDALEPPYWALLWSGARFVADWVVASGGCSGATVLDVGCGLGLVGLAAAAAGGRVTAVDRDPDALAFVRASATRSGRPIEILEGDVAEVLDGRVFDVVVAAELLYEREAFGSIARALADALAPHGTLYLGDARRIDTDAFYDELSAVGLTCHEEHVRVVDEEGTRVRVRLAAYGRS